MFHVSHIHTLVVHAYVLKAADEWLTRSPTHWSRVVLGKLRVPQLGDMYQTFCEAHLLLLRVQECATRPYPEAR